MKFSSGAIDAPSPPVVRAGVHCPARYSRPVEKRIGGRVADGLCSADFEMAATDRGITVSILAGCAAGPNFEAPVPPKVSGYTARPPAATAATAGVAAGDRHFPDAGAVQAGGARG
jgi:hypothetical protein